jgi:hypothetical protein
MVGVGDCAKMGDAGIRNRKIAVAIADDKPGGQDTLDMK